MALFCISPRQKYHNVGNRKTRGYSIHLRANTLCPSNALMILTFNFTPKYFKILFMTCTSGEHFTRLKDWLVFWLRQQLRAYWNIRHHYFLWRTIRLLDYAPSHPSISLSLSWHALLKLQNLASYWKYHNKYKMHFASVGTCLYTGITLLTCRF